MVLLCQIKPLVILCIVVNTRDVSRNAQYEDVNGTIFAARKQSLGQVMFFTRVCHSVHGGWGEGGLSGGLCEVGSLLMRVSVKVGSLSDTPRDKYPPLDRTPPPGQRSPAEIPPTVDERAVRILLECFLV